ncbi:MAG: hypothetical protein COA45_04130 [Zetaproteobacteria bacterium]|nr:MAG: hypothetical protein COA45_04130 [Zetaproteobacteria bacterium]
MANPIDAVGDIANSGRNLLSTLFSATKGVLATAAISTAIAAATGGLSLTADVAMAAGESIKFTHMDMLANVGSGFAHNLSGAGEILSGWMSPAP